MPDSSQTGPHGEVSHFDQLDFQQLGSPRGEDEEERRLCRRRPVFAVRRIAPWTGSSCPDEAEFFCVETRDLTDRGFSFFWRSRPSFDSLILATAQTSEYRAADVVHCTDVIVYPSGVVEPVDDRPMRAAAQGPCEASGEPMVLVGCRFTSHLDTP
ncbi:MAG: hypothetical protein JXB62_12875 [Pirellulales bacterium]|nr:hypothetical protein [Pirellulales bacterium]